jgi:thiol:disulfide interchange protein DsbD
VKFITNPLLSFKGKPREIGKLEKVKNEELDMENHQYKNEVDFVQLITVKSNVKTNVAGSIEFMACTDERCLPPAIQKFNLVLN